MYVRMKHGMYINYVYTCFIGHVTLNTIQYNVYDTMHMAA